MKKLNRNNADIKKILNKKVAIVCPTKEKELDFIKWAKQYVDCVDEDYVDTDCGNSICIKLDYGGLKWDYTNYFLENNYSIYEWEVEEEKTYTIKDVLENVGKMYIDEYNNLYFYDKKLYCRTPKEKKFRPSLLNLKQMLDLKLTEYKPEPKEITFEEALKEMEQGKVCRSLYSGTEYLLSNNHFEKLNRNYTTLSYKEIKEEWIVVE